MKAHTDFDKLTPGQDTAATLTPGHVTQTEEDGDYALASKFYNTEIQATKCADAKLSPRVHDSIACITTRNLCWHRQTTMLCFRLQVPREGHAGAGHPAGERRALRHRCCTPDLPSM